MNKSLIQPWYCRTWAMYSDTDWLWLLINLKDNVDRPTEEAALRRIAGQAAYAELRRLGRFLNSEYSYMDATGE